MTTDEYLKFQGKIYVINSQHTFFYHTIELLNQQNIVGFDTETRPSFKKGKHHLPSLIQFATKDFAILYQIKNFTIDKEIIHLLENPNIIKAGAGVNQDIKQLQAIASFVPQSFVDIQLLAKARNIQTVNLKTLSEILLTKKLSKRQQLSNWANYELTEAQKMYAATDAYACLLIYEKLIHETT